MNYEQIKNNEERIFPFYKGKYMGKTELGFSNKKSAQKFMLDIPSEDVYEKFGGKEEYVRTHECVNRLNKEHLFTFNPPRGKTPYGYNLSNRQFEGIYDSSYKDYVYLKDMDPEVVKELKNDLKLIGFYYEHASHDLVKAFEEKYDLFPNTSNCGSPYVDMDDFEKMRKKMVRDEIEYKRGIVHINIEYLD